MTAIQHKYKENINHNLSLTYFFGFVLSSIQLILTVNICGSCFSGQLGDVKLEDLPGPEALLRPGERQAKLTKNVILLTGVFLVELISSLCHT